jgi:hypothetical protein
VKRIFELCTAVTLLIAVPASVRAQQGIRSRDVQDSASSTPRASTSLSHWQFGAWAAEGTKQMIKTRLGRKHDRSLYITSLRAERPIYRYKQVTVDYTADIHPLVVATANREYEKIMLCQPKRPCQYEPDAYTLLPSLHTAYAFGAAPFGLRARTPLFGPVQFAIAGSGGMLYFNRKVPDPAETRFNFTADGNVSVLIRTPVGGMSAGFRIHHISNANTGRVNPAMDSHLWFIGYETH